MRKISKIAIVAVGIWLTFAFIGNQAIQGVVAQHVPGYPNARQIRFYVAFPLAVATAVIITAPLMWFGRLTILARLAQVLSFLVIFPYLLLYGGGV